MADLQAFPSKLQDGGVTINTPFRTMSLGFLTAITFITDPWGTYIGLNEGYASAAEQRTIPCCCIREPPHAEYRHFRLRP